MLMFRPFIKYADFSGRARRAEYWQFQLVQILVYLGFIGLLVMSATGGGTHDMGALVTKSLGALGFIALFALACFIPNLAVTVRRLHDTDRSIWWLLLYVPGIFSSAAALQQLANLGHGDMHAAMSSFGTTAIIDLIGKGCQLVMFGLMCIRGNHGENRFGPDPKGGSSQDYARMFDAVEAETRANQEVPDAPHKPVFDFGPSRGVPVVQEAAPAPQRQAPITTNAPAARATFGKRR